MLVVFSLALLLSQDTARTSGTLELHDVYRLAEQHNQRIGAAHALADAVRARAASARRPPDPQVQLGVMNYTLPQWRAMDVVGMTQLQAMQMFPIAGKLGLAGRVADLSADAETERADAVRWDVRVKVAMAFYDLYVTDRSLTTDRETLRLLQDVLRVAEAVYRVGDGRQADVLRAQVEIARMSQDTIRMATMRVVMTARLSALLNGVSVGESPLLPAFPDSTAGLDSLVATASSARPMLRAGQRDVEVATARVSLVRRDIWPDLTVGVQYGQRSGMDGTERMGSLMLGATLPIFARSRQLRMRDESAAMQQMARADLNAMRAETDAGIAEARANLVRARTLAGLYRGTLLPQAEAATESALASYRVGRVDFMTLLDNRMGVNRYRKELAVLEAEEGKAWSELEMLTGRELFASRSGRAVAASGRTQ
jgi:cobalt-zinc-cadmium efflux system outer membrane protein